MYRRNSQRERARWAESLYSRFFERSELKAVRDLLDCDATDPQVEQFVKAESSNWTDYLNFIEFVAYLHKSRQLSDGDVKALFGYYLGCLRQHPSVITYIQNESKGYEYLREMLAAI